MNQIEFIKSKLQVLNSLCPYLNIRYEYRNYTNTHIIDIRPQIFYDDDKQYITQQIEIENEFEEKYPYDNIMFVSEDSLTKIDKPTFELLASSLDEIKVIFDEAEIGELFKQDLVDWYGKNYYQCIENEDNFLIPDSGATNKFLFPDNKKIKPPSNWFNKLKTKGSKIKSEPFFL